ncbi:MAG TPA: hypothetical protein PK583_06025, partial [Gammaproteobacteria bacterium]|nr:hypothetical protein [Gammaproteobacteria bacterium]
YEFPKSIDYADSKELAIPCLGNNEPNERAKFSTYETIMYTTLLQKQRGLLSENIISKFILDFKAAANQELLDNVHDEGLTFDKTNSAQEFEKLTGLPLNSMIKINLEPNHSLNAQEKEQFNVWRKNISEKEESFDYILQKYILSDIKAHKHILRANRINHVSQYRSASAISGTPGSAASYHKRFEFDEENSIGIDGVTIDHLIRKRPTVSFLPSKDPADIIDKSVINNKDFNKIHAFLDVGSIFEGKSNLDIAQLFVNKLNIKKEKQAKLNIETHKIKHVLYFDSENRLCALPLDGGQNIIIDSTEPWAIAAKLGNFDKNGKPENRPEEYFTYYDQIHTTGIDIEQTPDAIAVLSLDAQTRARDCWQG